ncbi:MAG: TIGR01212 family radical SAM protein [Bacilli bacterium]
MNNPFKYSDTNLRYHSYSYYLKNKYHQKVFKVPLNAGFTCPNRDGKCGVGGCLFCSSHGSGDQIIADDDLQTQLKLGKELMLKKWPNGQVIAYFQAFSNTYASLDHLKSLFQPFIDDKSILELAIATRPDCLDTEKITYLNSITQIKPLTIELGLQSIHDQTMKKMNRGHDHACIEDIVSKLKTTDIRICLHIINGLPEESAEMMLATAKAVADMQVDGIKIHMLNILKDAPIATDFLNNKFKLLSEKEYIELVIKQLELLPPEMVIERLTGDGLKDHLIAPDWILRKTIVLNDIAKEMVNLDTWQGKRYQE